MGTKEKKVKEVLVAEVLSEDQIKSLPKEAVENVRALRISLPKKELEIFVPVVQKYIELRNMIEALELAKDEDGKITEESITEYKAAKKAVGSFNSTLKTKSKEIKDPINATVKGVIDVEKTFKSESDKLKEVALLKFKEYEDEIARKKQEALDKKEAEFKAQVTKANEEAETLRKQGAKSETINNLKYKEIMEGITQETNNAVANMNERSLTQHQTIVKETTFEDIKAKYDVSMIEEETLKSIEKSFDTAKTNADTLIADRLARIAEDRKREIEDAKREEPTTQKWTESYGPDLTKLDTPPPPPPSTPGSIPQETRMQLRWDVSEDEFAAQLLALVKTLEKQLQKRMEQGVTPKLAELQMKFNQFNS